MIICNVLGNLILLAVYAFVNYLGNEVCRFILSYSKLQKNTALPANSDQTNDENNGKAGRVIGVLERILITLGILLKSWSIIAGIVALKSISRYKELDTQINAEYFLIGSMASVLWAFITTFFLILLSDFLVRNSVLTNSFVDFFVQYAGMLK